MVVLGNQLFPPDRLEDCRDAVVFMAEDVGLCTYVRHHQQKIVLFLAAMRSYADELRAAGFDVRYFPLDADDERSYEDKL
jgi:deoxyribodipyrimidine photolyase-related protein